MTRMPTIPPALHITQWRGSYWPGMFAGLRRTSSGIIPQSWLVALLVVQIYGGLEFSAFAVAHQLFLFALFIFFILYLGPRLGEVIRHPSAQQHGGVAQ